MTEQGIIFREDDVHYNLSSSNGNENITYDWINWSEISGDNETSSFNKTLNGTEGAPEKSSGADQVYAVTNALAIAFIVFVVVVIFVWKRYQRNQKKIKKLTKEEVSKFLDGECINPDTVTDPESNLAFSVPYDRKYEIDLKDIEIERNVPLGSGAYGMVFKGKLKSENNIPVAIKTPKPNAGLIYFKSLLSELKVLTFIGEHEHIVKCLGASTAELKSQRLYIVVEFCALGSLESFLRDHRHDFRNCANNTAEASSFYQNLRPPEPEPEPLVNSSEEATSKTGKKNKYVNVTRSGEPLEKLGIQDLLRFSCEITDAMEYLTKKKIIHGDLATRNVLLNEYRKVKVTDFGLSRQILNYSDYVKTSQAPLPWRWLAIETIKHSQFSSKSDVWAFGVTMWEIFSLAQVPYPGLQYSQEFIKMLEKGMRMNLPSSFTSPEIYEIMTDTWHEIPDSRPTFTELKEKLFELCLSP